MSKIFVICVICMVALGIGCGAGIDGVEEIVGGAIPQAPERNPTGNPNQLQLANFSTWNGTASSEHFTLRQMALSPYNDVGASANFALLPGAMLSNLLDGETP